MNENDLTTGDWLPILHEEVALIRDLHQMQRENGANTLLEFLHNAGEWFYRITER